jgi:hypothetical protein
MGESVEHAGDLWADLFFDLYSDEFGDSGCSPFPECQVSSSDTDEVMSDATPLEWGLRGLATPTIRLVTHSVQRPH